VVKETFALMIVEQGVLIHFPDGIGKAQPWATSISVCCWPFLF